VFNLTAPNSAILAAMNHPNSAILSQKALEGGSDPANEAIGTGAFKLVKWEPDNILLLEKNPDFWIEGRPIWMGLNSALFRTRHLSLPGFVRERWIGR